MLKKFAILLFCGFLTLSIQAQNFGGGLILGLSTSQVGGDNLAFNNPVWNLSGIDEITTIPTISSLSDIIDFTLLLPEKFRF